MRRLAGALLEDILGPRSWHKYVASSFVRLAFDRRKLYDGAVALLCTSWQVIPM